MIIDLTGKTFGKLTVIKRSGTHVWPSGGGEATWLCKCECGKEKIVTGSNLRTGKTKSCGCIEAETKKTMHLKHGATKDGNRERLYSIWLMMRNRTKNPNSKDYKHYGGRGIKCCKEWDSYLSFKRWALENGYKPDAKYGECTIDRKDVNGDYSPDNCRWISLVMQQQNKRYTKGGKRNAAVN